VAWAEERIDGGRSGYAWHRRSNELIMMDYFVKSCTFNSSLKISNNKAQVIKISVAKGPLIGS
jgi:hypothetical protein